MNRRRWFEALVAVGVLASASPLVPTSQAVRAGEATGCSGSAQSYGPSGGLLDTVTAPGAGGTRQDPFDIYKDGTISYEGRTDRPMRNGTWSVELGGAIGALASLFELATGRSLLSGRIGNEPTSSRSGVLEAEKYASNITGLQVVTVRLSGEDGAPCTATIWVRVHGDFWSSFVAIVGSLLLLIGLLLLVLGAPEWAAENVLFQTFERIDDGAAR